VSLTLHSGGKRGKVNETGVDHAKEYLGRRRLEKRLIGKRGATVCEPDKQGKREAGYRHSDILLRSWVPRQYLTTRGSTEIGNG